VPSASPETVVDRITRELACAILRGEHTPRSKLPTVRALAREYDVTAPTIQRVVAQLEALGLVEARQGSRTVVNDPHESGGLALLPFWLRAYQHDPPRAAAMLADLLSLRRDVTVALFPRIRQLMKPADLVAAGEAFAADLDHVPLNAAVRKIFENTEGKTHQVTRSA